MVYFWLIILVLGLVFYLGAVLRLRRVCRGVMAAPVLAAPSVEAIQVCMLCGYDLSGLRREAVCPECGVKPDGKLVVPGKSSGWRGLMRAYSKAAAMCGVFALVAGVGLYGMVHKPVPVPPTPFDDLYKLDGLAALALFIVLAAVAATTTGAMRATSRLIEFGRVGKSNGKIVPKQVGQ